MIGCTLPEIRGLLTGLIQARAPDPGHVWSWSTWRRRRQHQARLCHYQRRGYAHNCRCSIKRQAVPASALQGARSRDRRAAAERSSAAALQVAAVHEEAPEQDRAQQPAEHN